MRKKLHIRSSSFTTVDMKIDTFAKPPRPSKRTCPCRCPGRPCLGNGDRSSHKHQLLWARRKHFKMDGVWALVILFKGLIRTPSNTFHSSLSTGDSIGSISRQPRPVVRMLYHAITAGVAVVRVDVTNISAQKQTELTRPARAVENTDRGDVRAAQ